MKIVNVEEMDNENYFSKKYTFDQNVQLDSLLAIAKKFENDNTVLFNCRCYTFDEEGSQLSKNYKKIDEIAQIGSFPSPYISFSLVYCDRDTLDYKFSLSTNTNSRVLTYVVDKKKLPQQVINQQSEKIL